MRDPAHDDGGDGEGMKRAAQNQSQPPPSFEWWRRPIAEWPERLIMRNISRDETVTIALQTGTKSHKRRHVPEPAPRMWFQDL
jgi:hypothetical protein